MTCLWGTIPGTGAKAVIKTNRDSLAEIFGQIISKTKQKTTQGSKPVREQQAVMSTNYKDNKKVVWQNDWEATWGWVVGKRLSKVAFQLNTRREHLALA